MFEWKFFLGVAGYVREHAETPRDARKAGPGRCADPAAYGERRNSIGGFAVDGLARRASKREEVTQRRIATMKKNILLVSGGIAALSIGLIALPSPSAGLRDQEDASPTIKVERLPKVREL